MTGHYGLERTEPCGAFAAMDSREGSTPLELPGLPHSHGELIPSAVGFQGTISVNASYIPPGHKIFREPGKQEAKWGGR